MSQNTQSYVPTTFPNQVNMPQIFVPQKLVEQWEILASDGTTFNLLIINALFGIWQPNLST